MLKLIAALVALMAMFIAGNLTASAEKKEATMDAISVPVGRLALGPPVGVSAKRSAVPFPHSRHFDYTCKTCHHTWDGESPVQSCTVSECHDQLSAPKKAGRVSKEEAGSIRYFKFAFHRQCVSCHREISARNVRLKRSRRALNEPLEKTGPTGCIGCHPRRR